LVVLALVFTALFPQMEKKGALYLVEEIVVSADDVEIDSRRQKIWVGGDVIRQDAFYDGRRLSLLYNPNLQCIFVLDHEKRSYYVLLTARDRKLFRSPLLALAEQRDGLLTYRENRVQWTRAVEEISGFKCYEHKLNYAIDYGLETSIWSTPYIERFDRDDFKRLWYAALGTNAIPTDVRQLFSQILDELNGIPIRVATKVKEGDLTLTTVSTIVHIERKEVPHGFFDLPDNYKYAKMDAEH